MRKTQRLLSVAAIAATAVSLAACGNSEQASSGGGSDTSAASGESAAAGGSSAASSGGVTTAKDVFGPGCSKVPTSGAGSVQGMVDDPVGTAASNNPLLTTLTKTVKRAGLVDTLNDTSKQYTVFAPANTAFEQPDTAPAVPGLLKDKKALTNILTYHVLPQRLDKEGLEQAGTESPLGGGGAELKIKGSGDNMTVTDGAGRTAKVLCGNVPTANATVFVIDKVLMPKKAS